jgi:hypothetical protein
MGGERVCRCKASSLDCSTPLPARAGSLGMPVGEGMLALYWPVTWSTTQLDRN